MNYQFKAGSIPLLVSMPHVGTDIPDDIAARMAPAATERADTDWHLVKLYGFLGEMGASTLSARWSRYVIDLNRPPEDTNLYPGQDTTGLCPLDTFHREPLYLPGFPPSDEEVAERIRVYWRPYHERLQSALWVKQVSTNNQVQLVPPGHVVAGAGRDAYQKGKTD